MVVLVLARSQLCHPLTFLVSFVADGLDSAGNSPKDDDDDTDEEAGAVLGYTRSKDGKFPGKTDVAFKAGPEKSKNYWSKGSSHGASPVDPSIHSSMDWI